MNDPLIRKVGPEDIEGVIELCALHAEFEGGEYNKRGKADKLSEACFQFPPLVHCLVAVQDGRLVGYATATKEFSTWDADFFLHMDCLYVCEEARGGGLGSGFIVELKKLAIAESCTHIQWQTPVNNKKAISFYLKEKAVSKDKKRFFLDL